MSHFSVLVIGPIRFWWQMVDAAPDDTLFTIVDCHI